MNKLIDWFLSRERVKQRLWQLGWTQAAPRPLGGFGPPRPPGSGGPTPPPPPSEPTPSPSPPPNDA